ncbi:glucosamine-6-phosphate deaminase [soil metagenome]
MQLNIFKDYQSVSLYTAELMVARIQEKPDCMICMAAGDTQKLCLQYFVEKIKTNKLNISKVQFVALDEWVKIPPSLPGSCQHFFRQNLSNPLNLAEEQVHFFNAISDDLEDECRKMDELIFNLGPIDLILVGIGLNGHIGFNEPGVSPGLYAHVMELDDITQSVGQKYFKKITTLNKGITLGLQHLMEANEAVLMANGLQKAKIIKKALKEDISPYVPASIIRAHKNGWIFLDEEAASMLSLPHKN